MLIEFLRSPFSLPWKKPPIGDGPSWESPQVTLSGGDDDSDGGNDASIYCPLPLGRRAPSPHDPSFFALMDDMDEQIPRESEEENKDNEASDYDDDVEDEEEYLMVPLM
jgi:hypothetical protein